ncbi:four helix bundle protein [Pelotomaculum propionicicum]|uniref:four helix bundle protein n=1 Tax=Pelotomaculum propionicicum TaxID=258475 RepID=UPI003B78C99D
MNNVVTGYGNLEVYKSAFGLAIKLHKITLLFPDYEKYELGSQLRRAAVSVALNIAEGYGRKDSLKEFQHYLRNALGSCNEVCVLLDIVKALGYIQEASYKEVFEEYDILGKRIYRLREKNIK